MARHAGSPAKFSQKTASRPSRKAHRIRALRMVRFAAVAASFGNAGIPHAGVPDLPCARLHLRKTGSGARVMETAP